MRSFGPASSCSSAWPPSASLCAFAHVLAMLILCAAGAALAFELAWRVTPAGRWRGSRPAPARSVRATLALLPLLIGCIYCIEVYQRQYVWDPNMYRDPTMEGSSATPLGEGLLLQRVRDGPLRRRDRPGRALGDRRRHGVVRADRVDVAAPEQRGAAEPAPFVAPFVASDARVLRDAHGAHRHAPHLSAPRAVDDPRRGARDAAVSRGARGARAAVDPVARHRGGRQHGRSLRDLLVGDERRLGDDRRSPARAARPRRSSGSRGPPRSATAR